MSGYISTYTTALMMQNAANELTTRVVNVALQRLGVKSSPAVQVLPNAQSGELVIYEPRLWCSKCKNAKATHGDKKGNLYCEACATEVQAELKKEAEKEAVKVADEAVKEEVQEIKPAEEVKVKKKAK